MILTLRTDSAETEVATYDPKTGANIASRSWTSGRDLEMQILEVINQVVQESQQTLNQLSAIVVYSGPGSFTGLRIGFAVANTLAASLNIPIHKSSQWPPDFSNLSESSFEKIVLPDYGREANITKPRK